MGFIFFREGGFCELKDWNLVKIGL